MRAHLFKNRKGHAVFGGEVEDFLFGAWLLTAKLVAWKGEDREPVSLVALLQRDEALVVRVRQASLGRYVDNQ